MPQGPTGSTNLRLGAAVAEIEGLYAALRTAGGGLHRDRLLAELARAGRRLSDLALVPRAGGRSLPPRSRWERRRSLAARGAARIIALTAEDGLKSRGSQPT